MATLGDRIQVIIDGNAAGFVRAANTAGGSSTALGQKTSKLEGGMKSLGLQGMSTGAMLGTGLAVGVGVAAAAGAKAVGDFANLTEEVYKLQNASGATAEEASALIAVADDFNISAQGLTRSVGFLGKGLGLGTTDLSQWGVEVARNADGSTDLMETVLRIGDAYRSTGDQTERNALVMKAFGRSGQELVPILQQDRQALEEFLASAEETGQIFSQADIDKGLELRLALDAAGDAVKGLSLSLGGALAPVVTSAAEGFASLVAGADDASTAVGFDGLAGSMRFLQEHTPLGALEDLGTTLSADASFTDRLGAGVDSLTFNVLGLNDGVNHAADGLDKLKDSEDEVAEAQSELAGLAAAGKQGTEEYAAAQDRLNAAKGEFVGVAGDVTEALGEETGALDANTQAMLTNQTALTTQFDTAVAYQQSTFELAGAQNEYNEALRLSNEAGGQNWMLNLNLAQSELALKDQLTQTAQAAALAAGATIQSSDANVIAAGSQAAYAFQLLQTAGTLAPGSPLRTELEGYANQLIAAGTPRTARIVTEVIESGGTIDDLIARLNRAEERRTARMDADTGEADTAINNLQTRIGNFEAGKPTVMLDANGSAAAAEIERINGLRLDPKTLTINVQVNDPSGALENSSG